ncbi:MAG: branched-chain amino acid ABC transporter permease [Chloroflexi bacterium]|nr:branched-chain amino acid ABC transporter permease [Chloroflexota bacterium]
MSDVIIQLVLSGILWGSVYALIASGLTLIYSMMSIINFAHGDLLMLAMYFAFTFFLKFNIDPIYSFPVVIILLGVVGFIIYKILIRRVIEAPMFAQVFCTFGLGVFIQGLAQFIWSPIYRNIPTPVLSGVWRIMGISVSKSQVITAIVAISAALLTYIFITKTKTGWSMLAVSQDSEAAALMGIPVEKIYSLTWILGAALIGLAGSFMMEFYYVYPTVGTVFSNIALITIALGGFGSIEGAFLAGLIVGVVESFSGFFLPSMLKPVIVFSLYLVVITVRPKGLLGRVS